MCTGFEVIAIILLVIVLSVLVIILCSCFLPHLVEHLEQKWKNYLNTKFRNK